MSTKNKNLFKEAIAEAKEIREAALINAKQTIEEAFAPKIQEMFDNKLSEMEDEDQALNVSPQGEEDLDEDFDLSSILAELDEEDNQITENYDEEGLDEKKEPKDEDEDDKEPKEPKEPKDTKPKSPAKPKEPKEPKEPGLDNDPLSNPDLDISDLSVNDLVKIVKDIIAQETGAPGGEDDIDLNSNPEDNLSDVPAETANDDPFGNSNKDEDLDEDFNLEELLGELDGLGVEDDMNEVSRLRAENKDLRSDLNEALKTIKITSSALKESNLVNAKLKRISSILKEGQLNADQKTKVIAAFDKATNTKEVNLVYESLKTNMLVKKSSAIRESLFRTASSKPVGNSTKKTIVDVDNQMARMQKLANIR